MHERTLQLQTHMYAEHHSAQWPGAGNHCEGLTSAFNWRYAARTLRPDGSPRVVTARYDGRLR